MISIDSKIVSRQRGEIRRAIRRSSPALVYSGAIGIIIIAANKSTMRHRIGKMLDRMACVSRGEFTATRIIHEQAANQAYAIADTLSRGEDVIIGDKVVQIISLMLKQRNTFPIEPLAAETVIVQLRAEPNLDQLSYIDYRGTTYPFERLQYLGALDAAKDTKEADEDLARLNEKLQSQWQDYPSVADLVVAMERVPEIASLFSAGVRRDIVLLNRATFLAEDHENVFQRLTL